MTSYRLPKDKINDFLSALSDYEVWAPVKKDSATLFDRLEDVTTLSLDLENQPVISKKVVFPQNEPLFSYDRKGTVTETDLNAGKDTIVFGIRPCDARSFTLLDPVFEGDVPDPYYLTRRSKAVLVGIACTDPFVNCFCTSIGGNPFGREGLDLLFIDCDDAYAVEVVTDRGKDITDKTSSLLSPAVPEDSIQMAQLAQESSDKISRHVDLSGLPEKLASLFEHPIWKEFALKCIGCGICTYSCPTCYCFDMQDETTINRGRRVRTWDSCMFPEYTLHASGHNPRPSRTERFRNRLYHKFKFNQDNFGAYSCVGCGRCISLCPVNIDLIDYLSRVKETE
jgi:ferredoxin